MAATWTLLALSALCWTVFVYPYLLYPRALRLLSRKPVLLGAGSASVSLLFCAHNEKHCLDRKLENLRQLKDRWPDLEILAYDDASIDGTYELLATDPTLLSVFKAPGRTGKAAGMKRLVERAAGDILVFTDANIILAPDLIERLLPYYTDRDVGGVCCTILTQTVSASVTSEIGSAYVHLDDKLQQLESRTGNVMGATGGLFSVRRALYPEFPDTVQDDFAVSMSVIFQGKRLVKATDVVAYENAVAHRHEELRRKMRIGARAYHTHSFLRPQIKRMAARDRFKYFSRKVLRWYGGLFLLLGAVLALAAVATVSPIAAIISATILAVAIGAAIKTSSGYAAKASEAILATFATLAGVVQGMSGRTVAIWAPAKSR